MGECYNTDIIRIFVLELEFLNSKLSFTYDFLSLLTEAASLLEWHYQGMKISRKDEKSKFHNFNFMKAWTMFLDIHN